MDRTPKDWPTEKEAQENQKKDIQKFYWIALGGAIIFIPLLIIGLLDKYHYLDPILDFLGIS
jgi:hypothetical protein